MPDSGPVSCVCVYKERLQVSKNTVPEMEEELPRGAALTRRGGPHVGTVGGRHHWAGTVVKPGILKTRWQCELLQPPCEPAASAQVVVSC